MAVLGDEVVRAVESVTGQKVPYEVVARRPGDPSKLVASSDRLRSVLGWAPRYDTIESIVETAWKWHQAHPDGYGDSNQRLGASNQRPGASSEGKG